MVKFYKQTIPLVKSFLLTEIKDFRPIRIDKLESYYKKIVDAIEKIPFMDYLTIESISNMGLTERSLTVSVTPYKFGENYTILLPPTLYNKMLHCQRNK